MQYLHRIKCITEDCYVYLQNNSEDILTECPNNAGHEIDGDSNVIVEIEQDPKIENDNDEGTTSLEKTRLSYTKYLIAGDYEVRWYAEVTNTFQNQPVRLQVLVGESVLLDIPISAYDKTTYIPVNGFKEVTLEEGNHTFKMLYGRPGKGTAKIRNTRIKVREA